METIAEPRPKPKLKQPADPDAEARARARLEGSLAYGTAQLGVPYSGATLATEHSWTVLATPLTVHHNFDKRVLGPQAHTWFTKRAGELFNEPSPLSQPPAAPKTGARGFSVRRSFVIPQKGWVMLVADAGGLVGVRLELELDPADARVLFLTQVEDEYLRPLAETCVDALAFLKADGPGFIAL